MKLADKKREWGFVVLCIGLLFAVALFSVPAKYPMPSALLGSAILFLVTCAGAWSVVASSLASADENRASRAIAGLLLVAPFALFAWLPGFGPPEMATDAQNELRYLVLLADSVLVAVGFVILARSCLSAANERRWSSLGFACAVLAAPLYAVFCAVQVAISGELSAGMAEAGSLRLLETVSLILLLFGASMGYLAALFFAKSLARVGWISQSSSVALVAFSVIALLSLVVAKASSPGWFELPLFAAAIPAVPWIMPALMGLALLRRSE